MKYLRLAVLLALATITSTVHADDFTRHWRVSVTFSEEDVHTFKDAKIAINETFKITATYGFVVGTTDDDLYGGQYLFSEDPTKDQKELGGNGTYHASRTAVQEGGTTADITEAVLDVKQTSMECRYLKDGWECNVGMSFTGTEHWEGPGAPPAKPGIGGGNASFGGGVGIHSTETWSKATHTPDDHFHFTTDYNQQKGNDKNTKHVAVTIEPLGPPKGTIAVFVPDSGYAKWLPEGPPIAPSTHQPDTLGLHLELRDRVTGKPVSKSFRAHYILDSSMLVGECMNWPNRDARPPTDQADVYFEAAKNKSGTVSAKDTELDLGDGKGGAAVVVSSRDWGGYAKLRAHVTISDGTELDAQLAGKPDTLALAIPKDDNDNHIGDAWEPDTSPRPANVDLEGPAGWASFGDGYTLFEEYRGFVEADPSGPVVPAKHPKKRHVRFDPKKRDVFIGLAIPESVLPLATAGIADWARITSANVHFVADSELLAPTHDDYPGNSFPRRADLWGDGHDDLFGKPQMALWVQAAIGLGRSPAHADPLLEYTQKQLNAMHMPAETHYFGSFGNVHGVTLDLAQAKDTVDGLVCFTNPDCAIKPDNDSYGTWKATQAFLGKSLGVAELRKRTAWGKANLATLNRRFTQFVFMHELGHAVGMYHHGSLDGDDSAKGEPTCPMRYWHMGENYTEVAAFVGGGWDLSTAPDKSPWRWCDENRPTLRFADKL